MRANFEWNPFSIILCRVFHCRFLKSVTELYSRVISDDADEDLANSVKLSRFLCLA